MVAGWWARVGKSFLGSDRQGEITREIEQKRANVRVAGERRSLVAVCKWTRPWRPWTSGSASALRRHQNLDGSILNTKKHILKGAVPCYKPLETIIPCSFTTNSWDIIHYCFLSHSSLISILRYNPVSKSTTPMRLLLPSTTKTILALILQDEDSALPVDSVDLCDATLLRWIFLLLSPTCCS